MTQLDPFELASRDFSARLSRRAQGLGAARRKRHLGRRLAVLTAAIAVPAMAQGDYGSDSWATAPDKPVQAAAMPFETPGESFPGSAFYYLADQPYVPLAPTTEADAADDPALVMPRAAAGQLNPGPMARAMLASGSWTDRSRALQCLTMAIYYEAATEPDAGQRAVAQVVLNRVAHPSYPNTICGVVFQGSERVTGCQFSFTCDGSLARQPSTMWWQRSQSVARAALAGAVYAPVGLATHYHTVQIHPYWADSLDHIGTIGAHKFYRWRGAAGRPAAFADRYFGGEPVAAPKPRSTMATETEAPANDPMALARAYENGLRAAQTAAPVQLPTTRPSYAADVEARGGEALFRIQTAPASGQVRDEYANSGQWLRHP